MTKKEYLELLQRCARDGTMPGYENGECVYRTHDGRKCAVGCAIPDEVCAEEDEGTPIGVLYRNKYGPYLPADLSLADILQIQGTHDECAVNGWYPDEFIKQVRKLECFADILEQVPLS